MTMIRQAVCSALGRLVYVDVYWDSPQIVEFEDGTTVTGDPNATYLIQTVYWRNLSGDTWGLELRHTTQPFVRTILPGTTEQTQNFAAAQKPDMRDISGITLRRTA